MSTHRLDTRALHLAIYARMLDEGLSAAQVAARVDVSASTLTRLKGGRCPDADGLVSLLVWLGCEASQFTVPDGGAGPG